MQLWLQRPSLRDRAGMCVCGCRCVCVEGWGGGGGRWWRGWSTFGREKGKQCLSNQPLPITTKLPSPPSRKSWDFSSEQIQVHQLTSVLALKPGNQLIHNYWGGKEVQPTIKLNHRIMVCHLITPGSLPPLPQQRFFLLLSVFRWEEKISGRVVDFVHKCLWQ